MASLEITFLGQSCFVLQNDTSTLLIDPGKKKFGTVTGDVVFATHRHRDHVNGVEIFLEHNPEAVFICNEQTAKQFQSWQDRIILAVPGKELVHEAWKFKFIKGRHGIFSGEQNTGVIVYSEDTSFGHVGDSVDFQGFAPDPPQVLALPIGGLFTASPKRALKELQGFSQPLPVIVPIHWLWRSPKKFCKKLQEAFPGSRCVVPEDGTPVAWQAITE
jgi:L-ascorbate metabolism protein UlaG (beta-lactamase superfamily)